MRLKTIRHAFVPALMLGPILSLAACATRTPTPAPPPVPVRPESGTYLGLDEAGLRARLGPPAFVRRDGISTLWRYDGAACRAFFFLKGAGPAQTVDHVETLPRGKDGPADPACLAALKASPASSPKIS